MTTWSGAVSQPRLLCKAECRHAHVLLGNCEHGGLDGKVVISRRLESDRAASHLRLERRAGAEVPAKGVPRNISTHRLMEGRRLRCGAKRRIAGGRGRRRGSRGGSAWGGLGERRLRKRHGRARRRAAADPRALPYRLRL